MIGWSTETKFEVAQNAFVLIDTYQRRSAMLDGVRAVVHNQAVHTTSGRAHHEYSQSVDPDRLSVLIIRCCLTERSSVGEDRCCSFLAPHKDEPEAETGQIGSLLFFSIHTKIRYLLASSLEK